MDLTFGAFQQRQKDTYKLNKYFDIFGCIFILAFSFLILFAFRDILAGDFSALVMTVYCTTLLLFVLGVYGLVSIKNNYQIRILENKLSKNENIKLIKKVAMTLDKSVEQENHNYLRVQYWKSWWITPYEVMLFADEKLISFHIIPLRGAAYFFSAKSKRKMLFDLFLKHHDLLINRK